MKILLRKKDINKNLITYDAWNHSFERIQIKKNPRCECCGRHHFEFLQGKLKEDVVSLCEKVAIQISPVKKTMVSFEESHLWNFDLSEEQRMWREAVYEFVAREVKPKAHQVDEEASFNVEAVRQMGPLGLLGLNIPEEYGGSG